MHVLERRSLEKGSKLFMHNNFIINYVEIGTISSFYNLQNPFSEVMKALSFVG